jgi:hypothetical protein
MPIERYDGFLESCDPSCQEFSILQGGTFIRRPHDGRYLRIIQINCDVDQAKRLLDLAKKIYPDAVPDIEHALAAPRES